VSEILASRIANTAFREPESTDHTGFIDHRSFLQLADFRQHALKSPYFFRSSTK
jgi:hypothetical protein